MKKTQKQPEPKIRFQVSGESMEASKQLSAKSFSRAIEKDSRIISRHKVKKK